MQDENKLLIGSLNKEDKEIYTDIVCYLNVSNLSDPEREEITSDILGMFLSWEKQNKRVKDMIGEDYKQFADDIITAVNPRRNLLQKGKEIAWIVFEALGLLLTIDFAFLYFPEIIKGNLSMSYDYSLAMAVKELLILVVAIELVNYIGKNSFKLSQKRLSRISRFIIGCCFGGFLIFTVFLSKAWGQIFLFSVNIRIVIAIIAAFWVYMIIRRLFRRNAAVI